MKTALVTGASSGIGLELARTFARNKHDLVLVAPDEEALQRLALELHSLCGVTVTTIPADLSKSSEVQRVYDTCVQKNIEIEYLVNDAGFGDFGFFVDNNWERAEHMIDVNVKAVTLLCRLFIPPMIARTSGYVLNIGSTAGFLPGPLMATYFATKNYILSFSESLYNELEGTGVHITCLCPGPTDTDFAQTAHATKSKLFARGLASPKDVADFGYSSLAQRRMIAIPGRYNTFVSVAAPFVPRKILLKLVRKALEVQ